jgi:hypothetical protein
MGVGDGAVIGITKILDHGAATDRFNIVLVAEGYQATELNQFTLDAQQFVNHLVAQDPFTAYQNAINVYRLDVTSTDSGADDPAACGGTGATPATYFDASFCNGGIRRLLIVDSGLVINTVNGLLPQWHNIIVIVNSTIWGGSGGAIATTCRAAGWENIVLHELGHAAFGLADEYEYWVGCGADVGHDHYTGGEPAAVNVTANTNRATIKWGDLIDAATPLPTTNNANCANCDPQPSPVPAGTVGAFEGAYYYHCDVYRPEFNCMMRNLTTFCAVCQRKIKEVLQPYMPIIHFPDFEHIEEYFDPSWIWRHRYIPRWVLVAYLITNWKVIDVARNFKMQPSRMFYNTVAKHLGAYLNKNVMPPKEIAGPIMNLADDYLANRQMTLKAGDYIALQNFAKKIR